jgi:hypothetical protein
MRCTASPSHGTERPSLPHTRSNQIPHVPSPAPHHHHPRSRIQQLIFLEGWAYGHPSTLAGTHAGARNPLAGQHLPTPHGQVRVSVGEGGALGLCGSYLLGTRPDAIVEHQSDLLVLEVIPARERWRGAVEGDTGSSTFTARVRTRNLTRHQPHGNGGTKVTEHVPVPQAQGHVFLQP